jgi:hypothetical protein
MSASAGANMVVDQEEAGLQIPVPAAIDLPLVAGMTQAQVAAALEYAERSCRLEAFLDERRDDPAARILGCFPQATTVGERVVEPFLPAEQIVKAFHHLSALEADIASLKPLAIFRIRQNPILFPSLAELTLQEIDALPKVAGFFHLTINPSLACSQQLAASALVARETDAPTSAQPETFADLLVTDRSLKPLVDSAFAHLKGFLAKLFDYQDFSLDWPGRHGPGRTAFIAGLTGEPLQAGASDFYKGLHACGCLLAGSDLSLDVFPKHDFKDRWGNYEPRKEYAPLQMLAAALGRRGVLASLRSTLEWETANKFTMMAAAQHDRADLAKWMLGFGGRYPGSLPEALAEGARKCGGASVPLLRWFVEEFKGDKEALKRAIPRASSHGTDPLPLLDYIASLGISMDVRWGESTRTMGYRGYSMPAASSQLQLFAKIGAVERLPPAPTAEHLSIILEGALLGGQTSLAEQCLAKGARWSEVAGPLFTICQGYKGSVSACSYWVGLGCPCEAGDLSVAAAHPNFPGWNNDLLQRAGRVAIRHLLEGDHEGIIEWITKNATVADFNFPEEEIVEHDTMVSAAAFGGLRIVQLLHKWGLSIANACFAVGAKGPSHKDIFEYIMTNVGEISEAAWYHAATKYDSPAMQRTVQLVVEKYQKPIQDSFIQGAAKKGRLSALNYALSRGLSDAGLCAQWAFFGHQVKVIEWLFEKVPEAAAALTAAWFQEALDEHFTAFPGEVPAEVLDWLRRERGIDLVVPEAEDEEEGHEDEEEEVGEDGEDDDQDDDEL